MRASVNEELTHSEFAESLWCNVEVDHQQLLVGLCYRSPTSTAVNDEKLLLVMENAVLQTTAHRLLIIGDFNFPEIDYSSETVTGSSTAPPAMFFAKTQELCLFQHATDVTRIRQNQVPSKLDYVFTDEENLIDVVNYEVPLGKSDHVVLTWKLLLATPPVPSNQVKYNYHKGDYQSIRNSLQMIQWKGRWEGRTVNEMWMDFRKVLSEAVDTHIPLKKEQKRRRSRLSRQTRRKISERCKAWKHYCQCRSGRNLGKYKQLRNEVRKTGGRSE